MFCFGFLIRIIVCKSDHGSNAWHFLTEITQIPARIFAVCSAFKHNGYRSTNLLLVNYQEYSREKTPVVAISAFVFVVLPKPVTTMCVRPIQAEGFAVHIGAMWESTQEVSTVLNAPRS